MALAIDSTTKKPVSLLTDTDGNLKVAGTFSADPPIGAATDAKLDAVIAALHPAPTAGTQSSVAASASSVTILAANAARKGATIYNDSSVVLYLLLTTGTASATAFTIKLAADESFVLGNGDYTGIIKGIWASATGSARVTEFA